jgi:non-canonical (house-cleaning) NTP pyrophosphatase
MKIAVGTTSENKNKFLQDTVSVLGIRTQLFPVKVPSGIPEQPLNEQITVVGARNRAKSAVEVVEEAEFGIGMEGGLELIQDDYYLVCAVVLYDKHEERYFTGISSKIQLPKSVSEAIKHGEEFGVHIYEYLERNDLNDSMRNTVTELTSRKRLFSEAIQSAFATYLNRAHY